MSSPEDSANITEKIEKTLLGYQDMFAGLVRSDFANTLIEIVDCIADSIKNGGKVLIAGNGGSAADAQHIAGEFVGRYFKDRLPLPAIALSTDTSVITCIGNDYTFDDVFARQVIAVGCKGDIFWGLSTSGNSENIVRAARCARQKEMRVISFTGYDGGRLKELSDICLCIPDKRTPYVQLGHMAAYHLVCHLLEERLCLV